MIDSPITWIETNLVLALTIQPKASQDKYCGIINNAIKLQITAAPTSGNANAHLIKYLARRIHASKSSVQLLKGKNSRHKKVCTQSPERLPDWIQNKSVLVRQD